MHHRREAAGRLQEMLQQELDDHRESRGSFTRSRTTNPHSASIGRTYLVEGTEQNSGRGGFGGRE